MGEPAREHTDKKLGALSFLRPYRLRFGFGVLLLLTTTSAELAIPWSLGQVVEALKSDAPAENVPVWAMVMIALAVVFAIAWIASRIAVSNGAVRASHDLRIELFSRLLRLEPGYYRAHPTGDIMVRLNEDVFTVAQLWGDGVQNVVTTVALFFFSLVLMLHIDPLLTLLAVVPYPTMVLVGAVFGKLLFRLSVNVQRQLGAVSATIQEDLNGIGVIKTYGLEDHREAVVTKSWGELIRLNMVRIKALGYFVGLLRAIAALGPIVVLWLGSRAVIQGEITLGAMVQFNGYLVLLIWPTVTLGATIALVQRSKASWRRLQEILDVQPEVCDGSGPGLERSKVRGEVEIRNLTIEVEDRKLLDDVSMHVPAGTLTAVVGRVGSGKSTLIEVLPRLLPIPTGTVFIDGRDINELPLSDLRSCIGYAPQDAFLFSMTVQQNIGFGLDEPKTADDDVITEAARHAGLASDVKVLPDGYDTLVGERGVMLSGGQRQRVALARALATSPPVLLLDDSLSSVDAETEREILGHLAKVMAGRTAIIISHRVAAIRRAQQIVVLDEGRVVDVGTHDELLARGGVYTELYQAQLEEEAELEREHEEEERR